MKTIISKLNDIFGDAFKSCGYDFSYGRVMVSSRPDLCQFQCNGAMVAAKAYKKNPMAIANEVIEKVEEYIIEIDYKNKYKFKERIVNVKQC